jgi:hypothetical protein
MFPLFFLFFLWSSLISTSIHQSNAQIIPTLAKNQYDALYDFYNATNGENWNWYELPPNSPEEWNFTNPSANPCEDKWVGVGCNCSLVSCTLGTLKLPSFGLNGTLPASMSAWIDLRVFDLGDNNIYGEIPSSIEAWSELLVFDMSSCESIGSVPSILGSFSHLQVIYLDFNYYTSIPDVIYNLTSLEVLAVGSNLLIGPLSPLIGNLVNLKSLVLSYNYLNSTIPEIIGNLVNLEELELTDNNFTGSIPSSVLNLTLLTYFHLDYNNLTGTIPANIGALVNLTSVNFGMNSLYGSLPISMNNLSKLSVLNLGENLFSGTIPSSFSTSLLSMEIFSLGDNSFHGTLPSLQNWLMFSELYLTINFFSGNITYSFPNTSQFYFIFISLNCFSSILPVIPSQAYLTFDTISAAGNYFTGTLPDEYSKVTNLYYFRVGNNYLTGTIPSFFLTFSGLETFNVSTNLLSGNLNGNNIIVTSTTSPLNQILLDTNFLTGSLPPGIGNLTTLFVLSLHDNQFTGSIPSFYSNLTFLYQFFIQNNHLHGNMNQILNETFLYSFLLTNIDLSNNQFTGEISSFFFDIRGKQSFSVLQSFAAVSNCLYTTIPSTICLNHNLTTLALDGLSASSNCQNRFFFHQLSSSSSFNGFYLKDTIQGSIPPCLFTMSNLQTLHLSGNGFTGSLSSTVMNVSHSLTDLSLSHNSFSGTIPNILQEKENWINLDLSYNKLTGTLSNSFSTPSESLYLQVNRLSGVIPSQLLSMNVINILDGNIFQCNNQESTSGDNANGGLPTNDPDVDTYSCASDTVNDLVYTWLIIIGVTLFPFGVLIFLHYKAKTSSIPPLVQKTFIEDVNTDDMGLPSKQIQKNRMSSVEITMNDIPSPSHLLTHELTISVILQWYEAITRWSTDHNDSNITSTRMYFQKIRQLFGLLTLVSFLIFLPIYIALTVYFHSYQYEYIWSISGILLIGQTPSAILFVFFVLLLISLFFFTANSFEPLNKQKQQLKKSSNNESPSQNFKDGIIVLNSLLSSVDLFCVYFLVILMDFLSLGVIDFCYIYIVLTYNSVVIIFAAIMLALVRVLTNNTLLLRAIPVTSKFIFTSRSCLWCVCNSKDEMPSSTGESGSSLQDQTALRKSLWSSRFTTVYHFSAFDISLLERLVLINNIIIPVIAILILLPDCFYNAFFAASNVDSSYTYVNCETYMGGTTTVDGYQCAPAVQSTSYSPPFNYSFQCSSKLIINYIPVYIIMFICIGILGPVFHLVTKLLFDYCFKHYPTSCITGALGYTIPPNLLVLKSLDCERIDPNFFLFSKLKVTTQITSSLAIIVIFGILFPPLAAVGFFAVIVSTYYEELLLGRLLAEIHKLDPLSQQRYLSILERDCSDISESLFLSLRTIIVLSCIVFAYLLFDIWGDENGIVSAIPVVALMLILPISIIFVYRIYDMYQKEGWTKNKNNNKKTDEVSSSLNDNEMETADFVDENGIIRPSLTLNPLQSTYK